MNELISRLIEESKIQTERTWPASPRMEVDPEKLVRLVVNECLAQVDIIRDGCDADNEYAQALGADWVGLAIERHLGDKHISETFGDKL